MVVMFKKVPSSFHLPMKWLKIEKRYILIQGFGSNSI